MRTTLTIDDDLAGILQQQSRQLAKPFKEVVNSALRRGLADVSNPQSHTVAVVAHDFGSAGGLDFDRLNQLVDELALGDFARKAAKDDPARY